MAYYATRSFQLTETVQEHQLLKFAQRTKRDEFCDIEGATAVAAPQARKLFIADLWRTHISKPSNCVFHVARYVP